MTSSAAYDAGATASPPSRTAAAPPCAIGYSSGVSEMLGLPTFTTDALGTVSSSRYDALGRLTETEVLQNRRGCGMPYSKGQLSALHRTAGERNRSTPLPTMPSAT